MSDIVSNSVLRTNDMNLRVGDDLVFIIDLETSVEKNVRREGLYFVLCTKGEMQITFGSDDYLLAPNDLLIFRNSDISSFYLETSDDACYFAMYASQVMLCSMFPDHDIKLEVSVLTGFHRHQLDSSSVNIIASHQLLIDTIWDSALAADYRNKVLRIQAVSIFRIIQFALQHSVDGLHNSRSSNQPSRLFLQFTEILGAETNKRKPLEYYADLLCVSPKYLSAICRRVSGNSAYKIILDAAVTDIKFALRNTDIPISELSEQFGFSSISFFGQFVKKYTGVSPREYRNG